MPAQSAIWERRNYELPTSSVFVSRDTFRMKIPFNALFHNPLFELRPT